MLQKLAENDPHNVINQVQEAYLDYQAINPSFFSLEMPSVVPICRKTIREWSEVDHAAFLRMTDGLYSALMSLRAQNTRIRYDEGSKICQMLAQELDNRLLNDGQFIEKMSRNSKAGSTTVLILDRREDPVTPLLNQWTYQAMIHELLGIKNNRVDLRHLSHLSEEMKEVVLSCDEDRFFKQIMFSNFGDVANAIHNMVQQFLQTKKSQAQFNTIEDMQRIIENFPEFKKSERNTTKHFTLLEELKRCVDQKQLYDSSEAEQEIVSGPDRKNNHFKAVKSIVEKPDTKDDEAVRLVMLFALRYENDEKVRELKTMLRDKKVPDEKVANVDMLIEYAGKSQRRSDLFQEASVFTGAKRFLGSMFGDDVRNVLQQHKSWLSTSILEPYFRGQLDTLQYPYFSGESQDDRAGQYGQQQSLVVFIVGGATYEEAKEIAEFGLNRDAEGGNMGNAFSNFQGPDPSLAPKFVIGQNANLILGSTAIHNSQSFLKDVAKVNDGRYSFGTQKLEIVS